MASCTKCGSYHRNSYCDVCGWRSDEEREAYEDSMAAKGEAETEEYALGLRDLDDPAFTTER